MTSELIGSRIYLASINKITDTPGVGGGRSYFVRYGNVVDA